MSSRRLFSPRRPSVQSSLPPSNDSSPNGGSTSTVRPTIATAPQPVYPDYLNDTTGRGWDAPLVISSMIRDIPALPLALSGPLTRVFDVLAEVIEAVKTMQDGRDRCTQLLVRVTRFLETLVDGLKGKNMNDTKIASSLRILTRNLMAIHADATQWSRLNLVKRYLQRDQITNAIAIHGENLTDCLHTFQIVTLMTVSNPPDRVEGIAFPGPPVSARPLAGSEKSVGSIVAAGLHDFFERPAGHAMFEHIGASLQGRLEEMGLPATSIKANEEALVICRSLVAVRPGVFRPGLAHSLNNLSIRLSELSGHEEALKANEEAVGIHRSLATDQPEVFRPYLAWSLDNLSDHLSKFGRHEEAVKANEEVLGIRRSLAADQPKVYGPGLAHSLNNLSIHLSEFSHHEEAIKANEEAVGIYRSLAADQPEVFRPYLAWSLDNLSDHLLKFGRHEEAVKANEEALGIRHSLATDQPEVFHPDLAQSLNNLSLCLSELGCHEEALKVNGEALNICPSLAKFAEGANC
ncbi:hypothetical protein BS47DRAFT_1400732 [Hydnum rufescens UP504]|uniref:Anaphase-promoting complex subunit 5 domain-containing protein n=1 Tax=Hydnum rufescens UP504 TaxID=1448309 RepID=A0A9P6AFY1_9AGAM|nr:hypothetical protein BS47DRAFT_1400732 [Hydnum rufescens UP504]